MKELKTIFDPLFREVTDGICVSSLQDGVFYMNPAAERLLDVSLQEARGRSLCELLCGHLTAPGSSECMSGCPLREHPSTSNGVTFHGRHGPKLLFQWKQDRPRRMEQWKDLRVRCLHTTVPLTDSWGPDKHLTIIEDISAERELERHKEDWQNMLVHDLRSPLSNIFVLLRSWQDAAADHTMPFKEQDKAMIDISVRSCRRILELLNLYLDVAKFEAGSMPVQATAMNVAYIIAQAVEEQKNLAHDRKITVSVDVSPDLSAWTDPGLLLRVLFNLINNALKFTPENGRVSIQGKPLPDGRTSVSVEDTGNGIDPKEIPYLFDRFHQAEARQKGTIQGTGLGLAFCREALGAMHGEIKVDSTPGSGSRFTIYLPTTASTQPAGRKEGPPP